MASNLLGDHLALVLEAVLRHDRPSDLLAEQGNRLGNVGVSHLEGDVEVLVTRARVVIPAELGGTPVELEVVGSPGPLEEHVLGEVRNSRLRAVESGARTRAQDEAGERASPSLPRNRKAARAKNLESVPGHPLRLAEHPVYYQQPATPPRGRPSPRNPIPR